MKYLKKVKQYLHLVFFISSALIILILVKGERGQGIDQAQSHMGPAQTFESSIARGRYALVLSVVENSSLILSQQLGDFSAPDAALSSKGIVSIFPPGAAFYAIPFYVLGGVIGFGQIGVNLGFALMTVLNCLLIYLVSLRILKTKNAALMSSAIFLFATNAIVYSSTLAQHQISTFFLLACVFLVISKTSLLKHIIFWFVYGLAVLVDIPNIIILLPVAFYLVFTDIFSFRITLDSLHLDLNLRYVGTIAAVLIPLSIYIVYNINTSGNPFVIGQFLTRYTGGQFSPSLESGLSVTDLTSPFDINLIPKGLFVFLFGFERSVLFFSPVLYFSLLGITYLAKRNLNLTRLFLAIVLVNIIFYSMFGDVWGGWAFGSRYLIPSFAILSILTAAAFEKYRNYFIFCALLLISLFASIALNTLGSISTTLIPPVHEAMGLKLDPTLDVAISYLGVLKPDSFVYNLLLDRFFTPVAFYIFILMWVFGLVTLVFYNTANDKKDK